MMTLESIFRMDLSCLIATVGKSIGRSTRREDEVASASKAIHCKKGTVHNNEYPLKPTDA